MPYMDLLDKLDGDQLLEMHEFLPTTPCGTCYSTGLDIRVAEFFGHYAITGSGDDCDCCSGLGFHFILSQA